MLTCLSITVESEEWDVYQLGALVQEAFPNLNPSKHKGAGR